MEARMWLDPEDHPATMWNHEDIVLTKQAKSWKQKPKVLCFVRCKQSPFLRVGFDMQPSAFKLVGPDHTKSKNSTNQLVQIRWVNFALIIMMGRMSNSWVQCWSTTLFDIPWHKPMINN